MTLFSNKTVQIIILLIAFLPAGHLIASSPQAVVREFYEYHFAHNMGFTPETLKDRQPWLTPRLILDCRAYFEIPQNQDEAPWINGDPFTGTQEYPQRFSMGPARVSKARAQVEVIFHWKETDPRRATVVLKVVNGKWLIDDIEFQDQESFRQLLSSAPKK